MSCIRYSRIGDDCGRKLVGLVGYPGVGKNALADYLCEHHGWIQFAFADALKDMFLLAHPCDPDGPICNREELEVSKRRHAQTREALQDFGQVARDICADFWLDALVGCVDSTLDGWDAKIILTDVRYLNESDFITHFKGGRVIGIEREGYGAVNGHASEVSTDTLLWKCDDILMNDGTIQDLAGEFLRVVE